MAKERRHVPCTGGWRLELPLSWRMRMCTRLMLVLVLRTLACPAGEPEGLCVGLVFEGPRCWNSLQRARLGDPIREGDEAGLSRPEPGGQCGNAEDTKTSHVWSGVVDGALLYAIDHVASH
jgi:hypothetical protein